MKTVFDDWLKSNFDPADRIIKQDMIAGVREHHKISEDQARNAVEVFLKNNQKYADAVENFNPEKDELTNWAVQQKAKGTESYPMCKQCHKESQTTFCTTECREKYINNIILFWKPEILTEAETKPLDILEMESRIAFLNLVRNADPDELVMRIKVLRHVLQEAYQIGFNALHRDKLREELDEELSLKGAAKKLTEERNKAEVENVELKRQINELKKSGEKINPQVKQGAKTGHCMICGKETLKLCCSPEHTAEYKALRGWMDMGMSEEKARETLKMIATKASMDVQKMVDSAAVKESNEG